MPLSPWPTRHPLRQTISRASWRGNFALARGRVQRHYSPVFVLAPLLLLLQAVGPASAAPADQPSKLFADTLDNSFEAMKRASHVYCAGAAEAACVHDQTASINEIKIMAADGRWPEQAIREIIAANTRDGEVNWVAVRLSAASAFGSPDLDRLEAINSQAVAQDEGRKASRRSTTECRTYATRRSARTVCTSY